MARCSVGVEATVSLFARNDETFLREHIAHAEEKLSELPADCIIERGSFESIRDECQQRLDALLAGNPLPEE